MASCSEVEHSGLTCTPRGAPEGIDFAGLEIPELARRHLHSDPAQRWWSSMSLGAMVSTVGTACCCFWQVGPASVLRQGMVS